MSIKHRWYLFILFIFFLLYLIIPISTYFDVVKFLPVKRHLKPLFQNVHESKWNPVNIFTPAPRISDDDMAKEIEKLYPNIPVVYWMKHRQNSYEMYYQNQSCAPFPDMMHLDIKNEMWQQIYMTNKTHVQVYSAHLDRRFEKERIVRITATVNRTFANFLGKFKTLYCQLWFDDSTEPVLAPMDKTEYLWIESFGFPKDGFYVAYLLGCSLPQSHFDKVPSVVSVVENACDKAKNMLKVINNEPPEKKKEFAVCVKALDFLQIDIVFRIVEWMEFLFLMGVDKIVFYQLESHPRMRMALDYYIKKGKVDLRNITLSNTFPIIPFIQHIYLQGDVTTQTVHEIIQYNDCFYRNVNEYEYIALLDVDEIIFPLKDRNWHDLIERAKKQFLADKVINCFTARHIYFTDEIQHHSESHPAIPSYMLMSQNVYRMRNFTVEASYVKTVFSTANVISCFNHYPIKCLPFTVSADFSLDEARMQHYRNNCHDEDEDCIKSINDTVKDTSIWDFKDELVPNVNKALVEMGLMTL